jgi:Mg/Co/Ni transporter MgtE
MKLKQEERIQGLSKTISSIKPEVLKPMLANLPDEVVKIIYDKAKVKDRAKIISALPAERSGRIVRQIAGESVGEAAHD